MGIGMLENEWTHYNYSVLERSSQNYHAIQKLLRDKRTYPARKMYQMVETALGDSLVTGNAINAAQYVWECYRN